MKVNDVDVDIKEDSADNISITIVGKKGKVLETLMLLVNWFKIFF